MAEVEMLNIPVTDIEFGQRARQNYKNLDILLDDFRKKGVIQPIAVRRAKPEERKEFYLLAGGRRYSAAVLGEFQNIPARVYPSDLDDLDYREIELMENISRENLDWKEKVWLTEEIHRLEIEKHGEAAGSSEFGHSQADTAELMGTTPMSVSRDRQLARGLEEHPELLAGAKNESEALRMLKRQRRKGEEAEIAKRLEAQIAEDKGKSIKARLGNGYILGDFFAGIVDVPDKAVNCVEIDPPYAIDLKNIKYGKRDDLSSYNEIDEAEYESFLQRLFEQAWRIMFPESYIICWFAIQYYPLVMSLLTEQGFKPEKIPGIWFKPDFTGQTHNPEQRLGSCYEPFIYAKKGNPTIRQPGHPNAFSYKVIHNEKKVHPTERPIEMIQDILATFTPPGGHVCVPFMGSGNTLLAAANLGISGFGFDLSEEYKNSYLAKVDRGTPGQYKSYG